MLVLLFFSASISIQVRLHPLCHLCWCFSSLFRSTQCFCILLLFQAKNFYFRFSGFLCKERVEENAPQRSSSSCMNITWKLSQSTRKRSENIRCILTWASFRINSKFPQLKRESLNYRAWVNDDKDIILQTRKPPQVLWLTRSSSRGVTRKGELSFSYHKKLWERKSPHRVMLIELKCSVTIPHN